MHRKLQIHYNLPCIEFNLLEGHLKFISPLLSSCCDGESSSKRTSGGEAVVGRADNLTGLLPSPSMLAPPLLPAQPCACPLATVRHTAPHLYDGFRVTPCFWGLSPALPYVSALGFEPPLASALDPVLPNALPNSFLPPLLIADIAFLFHTLF